MTAIGTGEKETIIVDTSGYSILITGKDVEKGSG